MENMSGSMRVDKNIDDMRASVHPALTQGRFTITLDQVVVFQVEFVVVSHLLSGLLGRRIYALEFKLSFEFDFSCDGPQSSS